MSCFSLGTRLEGLVFILFLLLRLRGGGLGLSLSLGFGLFGCFFLFLFLRLRLCSLGFLFARLFLFLCLFRLFFRLLSRFFSFLAYGFFFFLFLRLFCGRSRCFLRFGLSLNLLFGVLPLGFFSFAGGKVCVKGLNLMFPCYCFKNQIKLRIFKSRHVLPRLG